MGIFTETPAFTDIMDAGETSIKSLCRNLVLLGRSEFRSAEKNNISSKTDTSIQCIRTSAPFPLFVKVCQNAEFMGGTTRWNGKWERIVCLFLK